MKPATDGPHAANEASHRTHWGRDLSVGIGVVSVGRTNRGSMDWARRTGIAAMTLDVVAGISDRWNSLNFFSGVPGWSTAGGAASLVIDEDDEEDPDDEGVFDDDEFEDDEEFEDDDDFLEDDDEDAAEDEEADDEEADDDDEDF